MKTKITNDTGLSRLRTFAKKASGSKSSRAGIALPLLIGILAVSTTSQADAQTGQSWENIGQENETVVIVLTENKPGTLNGKINGLRRKKGWDNMVIRFLENDGLYRLRDMKMRGGQTTNYNWASASFGTLTPNKKRSNWTVKNGLWFEGSDPEAVQAEFTRICQTFKTVIKDTQSGRSLGFSVTGADGTPWILESGTTVTVTMDDGNCIFDSPDTTPPVIDVCPADRVGTTALPYDFFTYPESGVAVPAGATAFNDDFWSGSVSDDVTEPENLMMGVSDAIVEGSSCPVVIHRTYVFTDEAGNVSEECVQTIHVNNLFAPDAIIWHQPLARKGMSEDTDPSLGGPKKFKLGQTIPIKVHAVGCEGDITANSNVIGTVKVLGDTTAMMEGEDEFVIDYNGIGGGLAGEMVKIDGHLKYNLDTKSLKEIPDTKVYILQVTVSDTSTGESVTEELQLEAK